MAYKVYVNGECRDATEEETLGIDAAQAETVAAYISVEKQVADLKEQVAALEAKTQTLESAVAAETGA